MNIRLKGVDICFAGANGISSVISGKLCIDIEKYANGIERVKLAAEVLCGGAECLKLDFMKKIVLLCVMISSIGYANSHLKDVGLAGVCLVGTEGLRFGIALGVPSIIPKSSVVNTIYK